MSTHSTGVDVNSTPNPKYIFPVVAFVSVALYNVLELTFIIFVTFRKRSGLYFWSFCVATWGIPPYSIAFLLKGLGVNPAVVFVYVTLIVIGWVCTVTGQSAVLYSRLHLVDRNVRHLRFVRVMIVTNGIVLHSVTTVMVFGANSSSNSDQNRFLPPYSIVEKVQVTIFFLQELTISALYILATAKILRDSVLHAKSARARILWHLIIVNIMVVFLDITILGLEYADLYQLQTAYKGMAYSIKLKLEFNILNELIHLTSSHTDNGTAYPNCYIYDGSQQGHTFMDSPGQSTAFDNAQARGQAGSCLGMTRWSTQMRGGSRPYGKTVSSACDRAERGNRGNLEDGILVTRTVDVDVEEFERQVREMGEIGVGESTRGSVDITMSVT
jgi:hypothetical protein